MSTPADGASPVPRVIAPWRGAAARQTGIGVLAQGTATDDDGQRGRGRLETGETGETGKYPIAALIFIIYSFPSSFLFLKNLPQESICPSHPSQPTQSTAGR